MTAFTVLRFTKLKSWGAVGGAGSHNARLCFGYSLADGACIFRAVEHSSPFRVRHGIIKPEENMAGPFLSLKNDFVFKEVFGSEANHCLA